jgi:hypothetical protein
VDEDSVPTKLVWAMYDVGLVSTGGSGTSTKSADVYLAFTEHGVSSRLSDETRHKLIRYLEKYQGLFGLRAEWTVSDLGTLSDVFEIILPSLHLLVLCRLVVMLLHNVVSHIYSIRSHLFRLSSVQRLGDVSPSERVWAY